MRLSTRYSKKTLRGRARCAWSAHIYAYIKDRPKVNPNMPLDCNDGAALRVAPVKGPDLKLWVANSTSSLSMANYRIGQNHAFFRVLIRCQDA
jgi:hypothetical protein